MDTAYVRDMDSPGYVTLVTAAQARDTGARTAFICPSCGMKAILACPQLLPGQKNYRAPYFRHQKQDLCDVAVCERRCLSDSGTVRLSERLRLPLFLRPRGNGKFALSLGFRTENTDLLRRLKGRGYTRLTARMSGKTVANADIDGLRNDEGMAMLDLDAAASPKTAMVLSVSGKGLPEADLSGFGPALQDGMDTFSAYAAGAMFEYGVGAAGQKVPTGGFVSAGRPYLLVVKRPDSSYVKPFWTTPPYAAITDAKFMGRLELKMASASYDVHRIVLPGTKKAGPTLFARIAEKIQDLCGVMLCDGLPDVRPLWPPVSRKCDAYAAQALGTQRALVAVPPGCVLKIRKDDGRAAAIPVDDGLAFVPLRTTRLPVTCSDRHAATTCSIRSERFRDRPGPWAKIGQDAVGPGVHEVPPGRVTISAASAFEVIRGTGGTRYGPDEEAVLDFAPGEGPAAVRLADGQVLVLVARQAARGAGPYQGRTKYRKYSKYKRKE